MMLHFFSSIELAELDAVQDFVIDACLGKLLRTIFMSVGKFIAHNARK